MEIVDEGAEHEQGVRQVLEAAFAGREEADLIDDLRSGAHLSLLRVAIADQTVVGIIAFSTMQAEYNRQSIRAHALAPLAVMPGQQNRGIATELVKDSLGILQNRGADLVVVVGDPEFYGRFGFSHACAVAFQSPFSGAACQALWLTGTPSQSAKGRLEYAPPFSRLK